MTIKRTEGWETRLNKELEKAQKNPFKWGCHDCVTWASNCILAMTGVDCMENLRGTYRSQNGALKRIKKMGGTLEKCVDSYFNAIPVLLAKRGDLLFYGKSVGVCFGAHGFFLHEGTPVCFPVPVMQCTKAWHVPF